MPFKQHFLSLSLGLIYAGVPAAAFAITEGVPAGANAVAIGEESFASGVSSQAMGTRAVATGGNITPDQFAQEYQQYIVLIEKLKKERQALVDLERQETTLNAQREDIQTQIAHLDTVLQGAQVKLAKQAQIEAQKQTKETALGQSQSDLTQLQTAYGQNSFNIAGNKKSVYQNFLSVLESLDWNKLKQTGGRDALVQDLKNGMVQDFGPSFVYPEAKYGELIDGYVNLQGNITFLEQPFKTKLNNEFKQVLVKDKHSYTGVDWIFSRLSQYGINSGYSDYIYMNVGLDNNKVLKQGIRFTDTEDGQALIKRVYNPINTNSSDYNEPKYPIPYPNTGNPQEEDEWNIGFQKWMREVYNPWHREVMDPIILKNRVAQSAFQRTLRVLQDNPTSQLNEVIKNYSNVRRLDSQVKDFSELRKNYYRNGYSLDGATKIDVLLAPVLSREPVAREVVAHGLLKNIIFSINNSTTPIALDDLIGLEQEVISYKEFIKLIDYNSPHWLFDKNEYQQYVNEKMTPYMEKVEAFTVAVRALEDTSLPQDQREALAAKVIELRQDLKNSTFYSFNDFRPSGWISEITDLMGSSRDLMLSFYDEAIKTLLPYSDQDVVVAGARKAAGQQEQAIKDKQTEIAGIEKDIADLQKEWDSYALTVEESAAAAQKATWEQRLLAKQQELDNLIQQLDQQRAKILGIGQDIASSPLGGKGQNALAHGTNAFASGADSMAIGTNAQATGDNSIAQGKDAKATGTGAIAIGEGAQALKDKAIAFGSHAVANAQGAIAIGDRAGVGDKGINAIAMGTNSTVNAENAIGIGTNSVVTGENAVAVGANNQVSGEKAVSVGSGNTVTGNEAVSIGSGNTVAHDKAVAIGGNITETAVNSVNLGHGSVATITGSAETAGMVKYNYSPLLGQIYEFAGSTPDGVVTVGAKGKERRVQNVAAGFIAPTSTDAINGSQLYSVIHAVDNGQLGPVRQDLTTKAISIGGHLEGSVVSIANKHGEARRLTGVAEGVNPTDAVNMQQFNREVGRLDSRVSKVERDVKAIKGSVANAVAMASMPSAALPGQSLLTVGTGHSVGAGALAVGYSHMSDSGKVSYRINSSVSSQGHYAVGAGMGFAW